MSRRWLKPCPRCHGTDLAEQRDDCRRTLRCMQCGYILLLDEVRFLIEDVVLDKVPDQERTAA
jgi:ribosomal protein S27AE